MRTNWGYDIDHLGGILSTDEFDELTAGRYSGDQRIPGLIKAASSAIRDYCGWHVAPCAVCKVSTRAHDLRLIYSGSDTIVQLPARFVSDVMSVKVDGHEVGDFSFETNGLLRIYDVCIFSRKTVIEVEYKAGVSGEMADGLKELVTHRVTHGLAQSYGVQSEAAGGVSVTYNATWINNARATALPDDNKEVLAAYRLQGVF